MMDFFHSGRKFCFTPAVDDMYFRSQAKRCPCRIHCHITAAYYGNFFALHNRRIVFFFKCLHQVISRQKFIGGKYAVRLLAWNSHKSGKSCAGADKYGFKSFFLHQLVDRCGFSDHYIRFNLNPKRFNIFDFFCDNVLFGETKFRNSVDQYAARFMQRFKNRHVISHSCKISRTGQSCGTGTDHRHFSSVFMFGSFWHNTVFPCPVGCKPLQFSNRNRLSFKAPDTFTLALALLRADASADCRKRGRFADDLICFLKIFVLYFRYKSGNINGNRTPFHTLGVLAV